MNEAATATAIFPFIGMNRSTNPINLDHPPTPSDQPSSTPRRKTSHRPRHRRTRRTTRDRHQPRDGQPTTAINPTTARAGTDEPIPGPFRTSHHPTPPPKPLIPRGRTRKRQPPPRAKQPAPADRGKPDRFTSDHERGVSTGGNSEKRNELPSNAIDTRKPTVISQYPERKTSSQTPTIPNRGTNKGSQDPRTATEHCRADRKIPVRTGLRTVHPEAADAHACGEAGLIRSLVLVVLGPSPRAPEREHNEEVDRHADAGSGDQHETPSNTPGNRGYTDQTFNTARGVTAARGANAPTRPKTRSNVIHPHSSRPDDPREKTAQGVKT